jgi:hypothetical protein
MKLNKNIPFTVAPNALIQDDRLTAQARFVYVYMASMPDDWIFYMAPLSTKLNMGVKTLRKYLAELEEYGWLTNNGQQNENGEFGANEYTIHSTVCQKLPHGKKGVTQKGRDAKKGALTKETSKQKKQVNKRKRENASAKTPPTTEQVNGYRLDAEKDNIRTAKQLIEPITKEIASDVDLRYQAQEIGTDYNLHGNQVKQLILEVLLERQQKGEVLKLILPKSDTQKIVWYMQLFARARRFAEYSAEKGRAVNHYGKKKQNYEPEKL